MRINDGVQARLGSVERFLSCEPHKQPHQCGNAVRVVLFSSSKTDSKGGGVCTAYEIACNDALSQVGFCGIFGSAHMRRLPSPPRTKAG